MRLTPFVVALVFVTACPGPKPTPVTPEPPHLLWSADPQSLDNPFPDQRLVTNGVLKLRPGWYQPFLAKKALTAKSKKFFDATGAALEADVQAFGTFGGTLVLPSVPLDPASLTGHVARLQKTDSGWILLERSVAVQHVAQVLAEAGTPVGDAGLPAGIPEFVFVRPSVPLPENAEGALVFLKGITTADGKPLEPTKAWVDSGPDISWLSATLGVQDSDLLLVLPQFSGTLTAPMVTAATWADAHPGVATIPAHGIVPDDNNGTRPVGLWQSTDADWPTISWFMEYHDFGQPSPHPGTVVVGEFTAKDLRDANLHVVPASLADPSSAADVSLRFVLVLPKGPKPAGGWPIVMGQHGVGGRNTPRIGDQEAFCLEWAEPLTAEGLGCIGIDAPNHGSRGAFTSFFSVGDLPALRDRFREMTFDLLQEERLIATLDVDGDGTPDLNPTARYFGNSLGGIIGAGFVPYANHLSSAVLNVPGAGLSNIIVSPDLHDLIGLLIIAQTDLAFGSPEYNAAFPIFRAGAQPLFEVADPINAAHLLPVDRAVLVQEGIGDQTIPNQTTEDLAAALNAPASLGATGTTPLRVLTRVDPAKYLPPDKLATYNPHGVVYSFPAARQQVTHFLATDGRELTPP